MPPASGRPDVVTLAWQEWVKLVHAHARHVEGRDVHMGSVGHPRLGHIGCVRAAITGKILLEPHPQQHTITNECNRTIKFKNSVYVSLCGGDACDMQYPQPVFCHTLHHPPCGV